MWANKMRIINTIMNTWGGLVIAFPEVRGRGDTTFIYKVNQKTRGIICAYEFNEDWSKHPDVEISEDSFRDLVKLEDLFLVPIIIAVEYNDRQVFAKVSSLYKDRAKYLHEGNAFLPKDKFELLIKEKK